MNIVLLAAGTSSRMGKTNKLLLPCNNLTMVANSSLEALKFLESQKQEGRLIVVTGYRHLQTQKALKPCIDYVEQTASPIELIIVRNKDYRKGQFSSARTGVAEVEIGSPFFIQLADMPLIKAEHYTALLKHLNGHDAVRPFVKGIPGHPVLLSESIKKKILKEPDDSSVSKILKMCNVAEVELFDTAYIKDVDTPEDLNA